MPTSLPARAARPYSLVQCVINARARGLRRNRTDQVDMHHLRSRCAAGVKVYGCTKSDRALSVPSNRKRHMRGTISQSMSTAHAIEVRAHCV